MHVEQAEQRLGRIVAQRCSVLPAAGVAASDWPEYAVIVRIDRVRQVKGKKSSTEARYFTASRNLAPAGAVHSQRSIGNQLHWVLTSHHHPLSPNTTFL